MRFIRQLLLISGFFSFIVCGFAQNQINPGNQIRWPAPSCLVKTGAYLPAVNACQDISKFSPSQITWPVPCNGVYSPSTNTCVPTGTANNPGGLPGQLQINSGGNFAGAVATDIGKGVYDSGTSSYLFSRTPPILGFPFPAVGVVNNILIGDNAGQQLGNYSPTVLAATAANGSTTLTVTSSAGVQQYNRVSGAGIAAGTTVTLNPTATTITISAATTAAISGNVTFTPGATSGLIAIGNGACQQCQSNGGSVVIGTGALGNDVGYGTGPEDQNGVFIGSFAGSGETGADTCPFNTLGSSGGAGTFEPVVIGNKVGGTGCGWAGTQMIGNHIYNIGGAVDTTLIGNELGQGATGVYISPAGVIGIGRDTFSGVLKSLVPPPPGTYAISQTNCIGNVTCGHAYSSLNFVYGAQSFNGLASGTLITGTRNDVYGDNIANSVTTASNNILIGGGIGPSTAGSLSTGSFNVIVGHAAGGALTTGNGNTIVGQGAAAAMVSNQITAVGQQACAQATGNLNVCFGTFAGNQLTTGTNNVIIGMNNVSGSGPSGAATGNVAVGGLAGYGETSNSNTEVGGNAGRRNLASLGSNEAFGTSEFFAASGATGTEQYDVFVGSNSNCVGCTSSISIGQAAQIGAVAHAVQLDTGSNSTGHTMQWENVNFMDDSANFSINTISARSVPTIASAATIAPSSWLIKVSGTVAISNITAPGILQNGGLYRGCIKMIPTGLFTLATGGNIALASTAVVSRVLEVCYDGSLWYPSY